MEHLGYDVPCIILTRDGEESFNMRDKRYSDKHRGSPVRMNYIVLLPEHLSSSAFVLIQARVHLSGQP